MAVCAYSRDAYLPTSPPSPPPPEDPPASLPAIGLVACGASACGASTYGTSACGASACGASACPASACPTSAILGLLYGLPPSAPTCSAALLTPLASYLPHRAARVILLTTTPVRAPCVWPTGRGRLNASRYAIVEPASSIPPLQSQSMTGRSL